VQEQAGTIHSIHSKSPCDLYLCAAAVAHSDNNALVQANLGGLRKENAALGLLHKRARDGKLRAFSFSFSSNTQSKYNNT
jgi:hypothetical protein